MRILPVLLVGLFGLAANAGAAQFPYIYGIKCDGTRVVLPARMCASWGDELRLTADLADYNDPTLDLQGLLATSFEWNYHPQAGGVEDYHPAGSSWERDFRLSQETPNLIVFSIPTEGGAISALHVRELGTGLTSDALVLVDPKAPPYEQNDCQRADEEVYWGEFCVNPEMTGSLARP